MWTLPSNFISSLTTTVGSIAGGFFPLILLLGGIFVAFFLLRSIINLVSPKNQIADDTDVEVFNDDDDDDDEFY